MTPDSDQDIARRSAKTSRDRGVSEAPRQPGRPNRTLRFVVALATYALVGGTVSLAGWVIDAPRLTDWELVGISIQPNASVAVMASGAGLLGLAWGRRRVAFWLGMIVAAVGASALFQYVTGVNLETLNTALMFERTWGRVGVIFPGRMGPPGATSWTVIGISLMLASSRHPRLRNAVPMLALVTLSLSTLSITGYLYGADMLYSRPHLTVIAFQTATFIAAVSLALIASFPEYAPMNWLLHPGATGVVARRVAPLVILGPFILTWFYLQGQMSGLYDARFGMAVFVVLLIGLVVTVLSVSLTTISEHEDELRRNHDTFFTLIEAAPFGVYIVDSTFKLRQVSAGSQKVFAGVRPLLGRDFAEVLRTIWPEPFASEAIERFRHTLHTGEPFHSAATEETRADIAVTESYDWRLERVTLPDGTFGVVCYFYETTALRQAEQALRDADRRKNEFMAMLAHELRNPLAPIRNSVRALQATSGHLENVRSASEMIDRQVSHMVRLVDDLLDVSRISRGKVELRKETVELGLVLHHAVEATRPLATSLGVNLRISTDPHPVHVEADPARLAQMVGNLLSNACKFTPKGGNIHLTSRRDANGVLIEVSDDGIGISPEDLPRIFDMFVQLDTSIERSVSGLGIGLTLVRDLVELHGGVVDVRSEGLGRGSTFVIRLPVTEPPLPTSTTAAAPTEPAPRRRVVIVDDNRDGAESLALVLQLAGHETHTAGDGPEGLAMAERLRPDLVLLDIGLPGLNGYDVCRRIREQPWGRSMSIAAVSGWGQQEDLQKSKEAGFDLHLVKPVDFEILMKLVTTLTP